MRLLGLALPDGNQGLAATVASYVLARQQRSHLKTLPLSDSVVAFASKGDPADSVFYIQKGKAKVASFSKQGKEAVVAIPGTNEFFGEGSLAGRLAVKSPKTLTTDSRKLPRRLRPQMKVKIFFRASLKSFAAKCAFR